MKPTDYYQEFISDSYQDTDRLLSAHYPSDMDVEVYEGVLIDSFIGYKPRHVDPSAYNLSRVTKKTTSHVNYDWIVVLETPITTNSSMHHVYYTNDEDWVNAIRENLESLQNG